MSELQQEIGTTKSDIDNIILQQKVTDKKISNAIKSQEDLKDQLENAKVQRETLSLEMVDLQLGMCLVFLDRKLFSIALLQLNLLLLRSDVLEIEERKRKKILQWDAIKRACNIYKVNLDIHINLQEEKDCQYVKISFFTHNEATKDKYFVQLSCSDNHWRGM